MGGCSRFDLRAFQNNALEKTFTNSEAGTALGAQTSASVSPKASPTFSKLNWSLQKVSSFPFVRNPSSGSWDTQEVEAPAKTIQFQDPSSAQKEQIFNFFLGTRLKPNGAFGGGVGADLMVSTSENGNAWTSPRKLNVTIDSWISPNFAVAQSPTRIVVAWSEWRMVNGIRNYAALLVFYDKQARTWSSPQTIQQYEPFRAEPQFVMAASYEEKVFIFVRSIHDCSTGSGQTFREQHCSSLTQRVLNDSGVGPANAVSLEPMVTLTNELFAAGTKLYLIYTSRSGVRDPNTGQSSYRHNLVSREFDLASERWVAANVIEDLRGQGAFEGAYRDTVINFSAKVNPATQTIALTYLRVDNHPSVAVGCPYSGGGTCYSSQVTLFTKKQIGGTWSTSQWIGTAADIAFSRNDRVALGYTYAQNNQFVSAIALEQSDGSFKNSAAFPHRESFVMKALIERNGYLFALGTKTPYYGGFHMVNAQFHLETQTWSALQETSFSMRPDFQPQLTFTRSGQWLAIWIGNSRRENSSDSQLAVFSGLAAFVSSY